jgi:hypothetical protein
VRSKKPTAVAALATVVAFFPAAAQADPPARITIVSVFDPITFGENDYVNGQLLGPPPPEGQPAPSSAAPTPQGGQAVALEQSPPPFTEWTPVAQVTANPQGYYSFKLHPSQTLQYRTSSQGVVSERVVQVSVAPRIRLTASAAGRTAVRFSGTIAPALADQRVELQRQLRGGGWTRVATAKLKGGKTFSGRIRARHALNLRAYFAGNDAYLSGSSNVVKAAPAR